MNYSELKNCMTEYHLGHITRAEMVAAIALWQRPVECSENKAAAISAIIQ